MKKNKWRDKMKVTLIKRYSWTKTKLKEFDDDASKYYMDTVESGSKLIFDKEEISEILSKGLRQYLDYWADGHYDEGGSSSCGIIYIVDKDNNIIYDINNEPPCDETYDRCIGVFMERCEDKLKKLECG
jgi:hypothetical protein